LVLQTLAGDRLDDIICHWCCRDPFLNGGLGDWVENGWYNDVSMTMMQCTGDNDDCVVF
jgi:hypothetical protein